MSLYLEYESGLFRLWQGEAIGGVTHPRDIEQAWAGSDLAAIGLFVPAPAEGVPAGKQVAATSVQRVNGAVRFVDELEDVLPARRMVRKSTVQSRLISAGLMGAAYAAMTADPILFVRWFAPDHPTVYADDPEAVAFLVALGADPVAIMAEED